MNHLFVTTRYVSRSLQPLGCFVLCSFLCLGIASCQNEDEIGQLITDPSLDLKPGKNFPDSWFYWVNESPHEFFWLPKEPESNDYYLGFENSVFDTVHYSFYAQSILTPIPKGKQLTLRAKVKAENLVGEGLNLAIRCDGPQGIIKFVSTRDQAPIQGNFDWKEFNVVLDEVPEETNVIAVLVLYLNATTGRASFDDVTLTYKR
ncbi:hypothetical protein SAMN05421823_101459 [Catalinimonas alkaloidigena]|uniref:Uncharacterized protein n=1 Tax=Catalinimonas alkaloidigena TaxID=1075417 RepID=A0A1G8XSA4_9BACT|nr:hypothetical protein [Catalinimonas alkaloidigena]SDJ93373.1 hypothetical protein SAMN05421823_101459 [Catalinimonas alkaloidigena]